MWEKIVIDTCTLIRDKGFFKWLNSYRGEKILPLVAYVEYSIGQKRRGKDQAEIDYLIKKVAHMSIPQYNEIEAKYTIEIVTEYLDKCENEEVDFKNKWRDCMIASHAYMPPALLITDNAVDFQYLGNRVLNPEEIKKRYQDRM